MTREEQLKILFQTCPGGRVENGVYRAGSMRGGKGRSFHIDLDNGGWAEESGGAKGYGLKAYLVKIGMLDQFPDLADEAPMPQVKRARHLRLVSAKESPQIRHASMGDPVALWPYYSTIDSGLIGVACRFESDAGKSVLYYVHGRPTGAAEDSPPVWQWGAFPSPLPLYNQAALLDASRSDLPVAVVEGEKTAAALLEATNLIPLTWPGGAGKATHADWIRLRGRQVIIIPDNDERGKEAASIIRRRVRPYAAAVCILPPEDVAARLGVNSIPDKWDIADAGRPTDQAGATALALEILALAPAAFEAQSAASEYALDEKGRIKSTTGNTLTAIEETEELEMAFDFDSQSVIFRREPPWARANDTAPYRLMDEDLPDANRYLNRRIGTNFNKTDLRDAFRSAARKNEVSLFIERLEAEEWDGVERVDRLWQNLGCREMTAKEEAADDEAKDWGIWCARILLCGIVARAMEPGIQHDAMLILEGAQEVGKTSLFRVLGGEDGYFSFRLKSLKQSSSEKDSMMSVIKARVVEMEELADVGSVNDEALKAWLSATSDNFRAPYDTITKKHDRRCVFVASTNRTDYLRDTTGNRRFIPYPIELAPGLHEFNIAWLKTNLWQVYAEAREIVLAGFSLQMPLALRPYADALRSDRFIEDPWTEVIISYYTKSGMEGVKWVSTLSLMTNVIEISKEKITNDQYKRLRGIMSLLGCPHRRARSGTAGTSRVGTYDITPIKAQAQAMLMENMQGVAAAKVSRQRDEFGGGGGNFAPPPAPKQAPAPPPQDDLEIYCEKCGVLLTDPVEREEEVHLTCKLNGPPDQDLP